MRRRQIASGVWRNAGATGFWRGVQPNVARCFIANACELGCYDEVGCAPHQLGAHTASIMCPFSVYCSTRTHLMSTHLMSTHLMST